MKERIVDEQIRLIPYYQNDTVSFCRYQDVDVCKQSITGICPMI